MSHQGAAVIVSSAHLSCRSGHTFVDLTTGTPLWGSCQEVLWTVAEGRAGPTPCLHPGSPGYDFWELCTSQWVMVLSKASLDPHTQWQRDHGCEGGGKMTPPLPEQTPGQGVWESLLSLAWKWSSGNGLLGETRLCTKSSHEVLLSLPRLGLWEAAVWVPSYYSRVNGDSGAPRFQTQLL